MPDFSAFLNSSPAGLESLAAGAMATFGDGSGGFDLAAALDMAAAAGFDLNLSSLAEGMGMGMGLGMGMGMAPTGDFGGGGTGANLAASLNGLLNVPLFSPTTTAHPSGTGAAPSSANGTGTGQVPSLDVNGLDPSATRHDDQSGVESRSDTGSSSFHTGTAAGGVDDAASFGVDESVTDSHEDEWMNI